jgi:AcrR family transcriptional regulator
VAIKQRAMAVEDKEERRNAILDAAQGLFLEHPDRMANVAEVAAAAGVAKGTVYLYFPSKEEMLLALHERDAAMFFDDLIALLDSPAAASFDAILGIARKHIVRSPSYLPLSSICFGLMDRQIPRESVLQFKMRAGQMLGAAGSRLERHFTALGPGEGAALLCISYSLMVGLWQLLNPNKRLGAALARPELRVFRVDYEREVEKALRALWTGTLRPAPAPPAATGKGKRK